MFALYNLFGNEQIAFVETAGYCDGFALAFMMVVMTVISCRKSSAASMHASAPASDTCNGPAMPFHSSTDPRVPRALDEEVVR